MAAASAASSSNPSTSSRARCAAACTGPSSSSRCTMPSTFIATRVWNWTRPSVAAITSCSRNSRTASTSSAEVGRSCGAGLMAPNSWQQPQQVVLLLAHPSSDRRQLDRAGEPAEMGGCLHDAHHTPLERAEHLPPVHRARVDVLARCRAVCREELVVLAKPTDGLRRTKAPRLHTQPPEVFHRVTEMGDLPIEHRGEPRGVHDEVAVPEVAVHDRHTARRRTAGIEPPEPEL